MGRNQIKSKADIEFHSDGYGRDSHAALNVKVYGGRVKLPLDLGGSGPIGGPITYHVSDPRFTHDWIDGHVSDERQNDAFQWACESGWDMANDEAAEVFGPGHRVYSEGRSGGWMVVHYGTYSRPQFDREDVDGWDAIALGKWRKFAKWIDAIVGDIPRVIAEDLYVNEFTPWAEAEALREHLDEIRSMSDGAVRKGVAA